jgi:L-ascorbate metabolism protein UlaG (beta-lactamase superfamily)
MKKAIIFVVSFFVLLSFANLCLHAEDVTFKWFGQGCFLIETSKNTQIITDPMKMGSYSIPEDIEPDIVTISHEHFDHNQVDAVSGEPTVLRGLTSGGADFAAIDQKIKDVRVYTVSSFHDKSQGSERGKNAVFVFEFDGIKVAHLGDLGDALSPAGVQKIGDIDIVMIPVGGTYTIFGKEADHVISQIKPKMIVFPMHFKTDSASFLPYTGDDYTKDKPNVKKVDGNTFKLDLSKTGDSLTYVVLNYK